MDKRQKLIDKISEFKATLDDEHPLMICAEEAGDDELNNTASLISALRRACEDTTESLRMKNTYDKTTKSALNVESLEEMVILANEFDKSGDPLLQKQASVLDEILLTIGAPKGIIAAYKKAEEDEIDKLRAKYRTETREKLYEAPKKKLDEEMKTADAIKEIKDTIKEYRPLEAPLSTRTCPDHPGAQMSRIGENIFQCALDKQIYNHESGYTTMRGNVVPGSTVSNQTQNLNDLSHISNSIFDTREARLNL